MTFEDLVVGKRIAYMPIYSMFSHETGKIDLCCDGNVNRWLTSFNKANKMNKAWKELNLFIPSQDNCKNFEKFFNILLGIGSVCSRDEYIPEKLTGIIYYDECPHIKKNAGYQRGREFAELVVAEVKSKNVDLIVAEGQELVGLLADDPSIESEIAYWCPVCATNKKTRTFLTKDKEKNEELFKKVDYIITAAKEQNEYLLECGVPEDKIIYVHQMIDRHSRLFDYDLDDVTVSMFKAQSKIVYLPFRLSDEGYRVWDIIKSLNQAGNKALVFAPNMNDTSYDDIRKLCYKFCPELGDGQIEFFYNKLMSVSSSRDTYYSIIDNCENVAIPYFEDYDFVMHAAVDELVRDKSIKANVFTSTDDFVSWLKS